MAKRFCRGTEKKARSLRFASGTIATAGSFIGVRHRKLRSPSLAQIALPDCLLDQSLARDREPPENFGVLPFRRSCPAAQTVSNLAVAFLARQFNRNGPI
jgi:hypothetical protein